MDESLIAIIGFLAGVVIFSAPGVYRYLKTIRKISNTSRMLEAYKRDFEPEYIRLLRDPNSTAADVRNYENTFLHKWGFD